jgi:hypothetical protein
MALPRISYSLQLHVLLLFHHSFAWHALRKLERDFQSETTITPKQKQLSKQGVGLEHEQQDSELKGIINQMSKMNTRLEMIEQGQQSRGRGTIRSREDQPKYRLQNSNRLTYCRRLLLV